MFEAIGGAGKSMLTWEWATNHAINVRADWAGRFWYSFYEKGAIMAGQPLEDFGKKKTAELGELLLHHLQAHPWLLILDGLERVLVAYHRFDAAQLADEKAGITDEIAHRDPCAAIRPEDDDFLRALAAAGSSKILITARLIPRVLLNSASQPIPGVLHERLPGLRPTDAETLLRACGVTGTSPDIQHYLKSHCDCHPLVTGVLAGLINNYLPDRGNFDSWAADSAGGGQLNLADLDLIQKRNHILHAALEALPERSRQLLSTLALFSQAVNYATLSALNPHLPGLVRESRKSGFVPLWNEVPDRRKTVRQTYLQLDLERRKEYQEAHKAQQSLPSAEQELTRTVSDLEHRGLLQYDHQSKRYDLHPVVRGVAAGGLGPEDKERYGRRVVDVCSREAHIPFENAETFEDVRLGLHVVSVLLQMGHRQQACDAYLVKLCRPLLVNLEANAELLSVTRPFFPQGWGSLPDGVPELQARHLVSDAAMALRGIGELKESLAANGVLIVQGLQREDWRFLSRKLLSVAHVCDAMNRLAQVERLILFALELPALQDDSIELFLARIYRFEQLAKRGRIADAESMWQLLEPMGLAWPLTNYRLGTAEIRYARFRFEQGILNDDYLTHAQQVVKTGKNRSGVRGLHCLRGEWRIEQGQWALAADSLHEAVRMAREIGQTDAAAEAMLCLAKLHLGRVLTVRDEAEQLAKARKPPDRALGNLWVAIGEREQAKKHALAAYKTAWADGEPYVYRYELNKARDLLVQLGVEIPNLPPYDHARDEKLPWEDEVSAVVEKLRTKKQTERRREENKLK